MDVKTFTLFWLAVGQKIIHFGYFYKAFSISAAFYYWR